MIEIFGHHSIKVWLGVIVWTTIILSVYKIFKAPNKENGFKWSYFINNNWRDYILNLVISALLLRMGDSAIHSIYNWLNVKFLTPLGLTLDADGMDVVIIVAVITFPLSYMAHKYLRPKISE